MTAQFPHFTDESFPAFIRERAAPWLESRGRDAPSLIAMGDLTGDWAFIEEAERLHPKNAVVCSTMIQRCLIRGHSGKVRHWADQMIMSDPANPMGYYYIAALAAQEAIGVSQIEWPKAGIVSALELALKIPQKPNSFLGERISTAKEAALAAGASTGEASMAGLTRAQLHSSGPGVRGSIFRSLLSRIKYLRDSGALGQTREIAELGYRATIHFGYYSNIGILEEANLHSSAVEFLQTMDPLTEIGWSGATVESLLQSAISRSEKIQSLITILREGSVRGFLRSAPDAIITAFVDRWNLNGESAAVTQLLEYRDLHKPLISGDPVAPP